MGWLSLILKLSLTQDLCARSLHGNLGLIRGAHIALSRASKDLDRQSNQGIHPRQRLLYSKYIKFFFYKKN